MPRKSRSNDWGFPRWRGYENSREPQTTRLCDRHGCNDIGECPAPKSPHSNEKWLFCKIHAAEYNQDWDYFAGLSETQAKQRQAQEAQQAQAYQKAAHYNWTRNGDGSRSAEEIQALEVLGLDSNADLTSIRAAWRNLAKETHPDVNPNDSNAAKRFHKGQKAFEILQYAATKS